MPKAPFAHVADSGSYKIVATYEDWTMLIFPEDTVIRLTPEDPVDTVLFYVIPDTSGILEKALPKNMDLTVHPNPFNSAVTISLNYGSESAKPLSALPPGARRVEIFDINGKTVKR